MSSVGTYVLSGNEPPSKGDPDLPTASAKVLRLLGQKKKCPLAELISLTGFSETLLRAAVEDLRRKELVDQDGEVLRLTPLGERAHLIVAA